MKIGKEERKRGRKKEERNRRGRKRNGKLFFLSLSLPTHDRRTDKPAD